MCSWCVYYSVCVCVCDIVASKLIIHKRTHIVCLFVCLCTCMLLQGLKMNSQNLFYLLFCTTIFPSKVLFLSAPLPRGGPVGIHSLYPRLVQCGVVCGCVCVFGSNLGYLPPSYHCGEAGFRAGARTGTGRPAGEQERVWSEAEPLGKGHP